ncbi:HIRAN domain-containing protein [Clostridium beijerinckii]|uniref:DNA-binding protein n=1 Tax=Clostridium beijerinckii TaxID=1520 RepID=A0A7X9SR48_CLOBE|nr:HIRAN domain-containing protein [Clostridium beijerinckii]NMF06566.1 DNA-binding protein [Clostridium beijerinckii]
MSKKDGKDYVYLIWKDPKSRRQYRIGQLSKNGQYEFQYGFEIQQAIEKGFELLISFDDLKKKYFSDKLFSPFLSRVPDRRRKGIKDILEKYGLDEYNEYELLKKSGGRLPIDSIEFIDPILDNGEDPIERSFYIAGPRHYIGCDGDCCNTSIELNKGEKLYLELQPTNEHDSYAVKIVKSGNILIGYIPRYYSQAVFEFISKGAKYTLEVEEVNKDKNCNECLNATLKINRN